MAVLLHSVHMAGAWLCWQAAALHPLFEHKRGTAGAYSSAGHGTWKTLLCSITERCQIIDFPDGHWPQLGTRTSLLLRGPQLRPCVGLFRARLLNKRQLPWICPLAGLSAMPWASCNAQCHSWKDDDPALLATGFAYIHGGEPVRACRLCTQLGGVGYKHAGSDRWASHNTWDNSSWGNVTRLLHGSLGLLVLPWYMVVCGEALAQPPCSVPRQQ